MATSKKHSGFKRLIDRDQAFSTTDSTLAILVEGQEALAFKKDSVGTYGLLKLGYQPAEALASIVDGYGVSLATGYSASGSNRIYALEINADTGSTDLTGDTNVGAIKGRVVIGTTQTNFGASAIVGTLDVGTVNTVSNQNGICAVLDFYGNCTITGSSSHMSALSAVVWNEATTTLNSSGGCIAGLDLVQNSGQPAKTAGINPAINIRAGTSSRWQYGIYMADVERPFYATATMSGSTAWTALDLQVTDTQTIATGYSQGIHVNYTKTGAQTGGQINPFAIDFSATTANCTDVALEELYISQTGNKLTGNVAAWQLYCEDPGTGVLNMMLIDVGFVAGTHASASRYAAMRVKNNATAARLDEVFYIEGTSNYCATNLFTFCGCVGASDLLVNAATSGNVVYKLKVLIENTPGAGGTTGYIPIYEA